MDVINQTVTTVTEAFNQQLTLLLPKLAAAIALLLIGWIVSLLLSKLVAAIARKGGLDRASKNANVDEVLSNAGIRNIRMMPSLLLGRIIFWLLMTVFFVSAMHTLGLTKLASLFDNVALFLPKLIAATMIFLFGVVLSQLLGKLVRKATQGIGQDYAQSLGGFVSSVMTIVVVVLAIGQLEIDTTLLNIVIAIFLVILGVAVALSLGLGTRDLARNIVYGAYVRDNFQLGMPIKFREYSGRIIEINSVNTLIEDNAGKRIYIPNSDLMNEVITSE
jgi:small-conductance mechanosensitive channel